MKTKVSQLYMLGLGLALGAMATGVVRGGDWWQFRGPGGNGVATDPKAVVSTKLEAGAIRWKAALPGRGLSSPIIVGDQVFITAASGSQQERLHLQCFAADTGKLKWQRELAATGRTMCHEKTCVAAPTPCSDGRHIYVQFSSNDVAAFTLAGEVLWMRGLTMDYPNASNSLGMASSLAVAGGTVVVMVENDSDSFTAGLDAMTGRNVWKLARKKSANWTSPLLGGSAEQPWALLLGQDGAVAVDVKTGSELWKVAGGHTMVSAALAGKNTLVVPANGTTVFQIKETGAPDEVWKSAQLASGTASPVVWKDRVLTINNSGVLACGDLASGDVKWKLRMKGPFSGSPVVAGDRLFVVSEAGVLQAVTLDAEKEPTAVEELSLGEKVVILCTPSLSDGAIYLRSDQQLWKIGG